MSPLQVVDGLAVLDRARDYELYHLVVNKTRLLGQNGELAPIAAGDINFKNVTRSIENSLASLKRDDADLQDLDLAWRDWRTRFDGAFRERGDSKKQWDLGAGPRTYMLLMEMTIELANELTGLARQSASANKRTQHALVALLARTPELFLQRMRLIEPDTACPPRFHFNSFGRQELPEQLRYAPTLKFPQNPVYELLPFKDQGLYNGQVAQPSIPSLVEEAIRIATSPSLGSDEDTGLLLSSLSDRVHQAMLWLTSAVVHEWYKSTTHNEALAFAALVRDLPSEIRQLHNANGPFLTAATLTHIMPDGISSFTAPLNSHEATVPFPYSCADLARRNSAEPVPHGFVRFLPPDHPHRLQVERSLGFRKAIIYGSRARI